MGTGRGHEHVAPIQARGAGTTPNSPKKGGDHSASENPIGIETYARRGGRSVEDHHRNASGATVVFCVAI